MLLGWVFRQLRQPPPIVAWSLLQGHSYSAAGLSTLAFSDMFEALAEPVSDPSFSQTCFWLLQLHDCFPKQTCIQASKVLHGSMRTGCMSLLEPVVAVVIMAPTSSKCFPAMARPLRSGLEGSSVKPRRDCQARAGTRPARGTQGASLGARGNNSYYAKMPQTMGGWFKVGTLVRGVALRTAAGGSGEWTCTWPHLEVTGRGNSR